MMKTLRTVSALLLLGGLTTGTAAHAKPATHAAPPRFPHNVGVELYSFRKQLKVDFKGTLAAVAAMGVTDVEVADLQGLTAADYRAALDAAGLHARSMMASYDDLAKGVDPIIADAKTLGVAFVVTPWIPHADGTGAFTAAHAQKAIADFSQWGDAIKRAGLRYLYHAHGYELGGDFGHTLLDDMLAKTKPEVLGIEIDIFWFVHAGQDPERYLEKYPDRILLMHAKDMRKGSVTGRADGKEDVEADVALGTGQIDLPPIFRAAIKNRLAWIFVEDESSHSLEQVPVSLSYCKSFAKAPTRKAGATP